MSRVWSAPIISAPLLSRLLAALFLWPAAEAEPFFVASRPYFVSILRSSDTAHMFGPCSSFTTGHQYNELYFKNSF